MNRNVENITKELLKKGLLEVPDEDFTGRVMEKIRLEARPKRKFLSTISLAWIFTILSIIIVPSGLTAIIRNLRPIRILNMEDLVIDPSGISILLYIFFTSVILFILDGLIRQTFKKH